ncbi:MAG TPA: hemagglutination activity domain protein, partial [Cyanobacteria bacterium UBA12227]|nr:hemagglutination activity domain protein [Cyanobacteria bacterium UBA12227]
TTDGGSGTTTDGGSGSTTNGSTTNGGNGTTTDGGSGTTTGGNGTDGGGSVTDGDTNPDDNGTKPTPNSEPNQQHSNQQDSNSESEQDSDENDPVSQLEETFTKQFEQYFQRSLVTKTYNEQNTRDRIQDIEQATGIKTAIIYISFTSSLTSPETQCQTQPVSPTIDRRFGHSRSEQSQSSNSCSTAANDELELLMITADGATIRRRIAGANRTNVVALTQEFQRAISNPQKTNSNKSNSQKTDSTNYLSSAQQLYQWLIEPLSTDLQSQKIQSLVFAMDTGLRSLPLAALHDGKGFLIEQYSVSLVPSLSLTEPGYRDVRPLQVLAMGASKFTDQPPLPWVPVELETITEQLWKGKSFLNEGFTLQNLRSQLSQHQFGIVHLATHAEFKPGSPEDSYIQLWNSKLRLNELAQLQLSDPPVDLLVLSACRTALGNPQAELGFAGSALQAGVDSTLATLWYVSDQGALGLTTEFYRQLSQVPIKSEALRRAQLAMIRGNVRIANNQLYNSDKQVSLPPELSQTTSPNLSDPYYWAAFTLVGNPW